MAGRSLLTINGAETWMPPTSSAGDLWAKVLQFLSRPDVIAIIMVWWVTFTVVTTIIICLGFGPAGVVAGSLAAAFQSFMYGGFTPAGGIFATLTSMAMLGTLMFPAAVIAVVFATGTSVVAWKLGIGK
ncbi:hypothetical protein BO71DRAFT_399203 [Aspergillus ellipticus CBS 707.79]|uniref:Uncharacterized protein n=1 Tax=Aspergillus ellipticus CBS 707.79 TaxID=1448320 RepID=A0A319ESR8_9EURO|nr:hypothetical protein BO71DRAFT_399203 [Aspergillus ellipticus CBS 707.79]